MYPSSVEIRFIIKNKPENIIFTKRYLFIKTVTNGSKSWRNRTGHCGRIDKVNK